MRVWLVDPFGHGGIGRYAVDVANLLTGALPTTVATSSEGPVPGARSASTTWFPRRTNEGRAGKVRAGLAGLLNAYRRPRPGDVAWVALGIRPAFELALVCALRLRRCKVVSTVHNRGPHSGDGDSAAVVRAAALCCAVVVHTSALAQWANERSLKAVRLPFPPPDITDAPEASLTRETLGIAGDAVVVGLLGYLYPYKGPDVLLEALRTALAAAALPVHLLLAGRPHPEMDLAELVTKLELAEHVTLLSGWLAEDQIADLLAVTDVIALPYRAIDNSGMGALARRRGLPAVASDLANLRELLGDTALYSPPGDIAGLARSLGALPDRLAELRELAGRSVPDELETPYREFVAQLGST